MSDVAFPLTVDSRGRTAAAGTARHIADLVEAVLFTAPGERVNRPDFGAGLAQLLFAPVDESVVSAAELQARSGLQRWLGEAIEVEDLAVELGDAAVRVTVRYRLRTSGDTAAVTFERSP